MNVAAAVLAGGAGSRVGGGKPGLLLGGRPLISYPLAALRRAGFEPVVVAKGSTVLPDLDAPLVFDAARVLHPFSGVLAALDHAGGRAVLVVGADMPFVTAALLRRLADADPGAAVVMPRGHPLCARYGPGARDAIAAALAAEAPVRRTLAALGAVEVAVAEPELFNVNTLDDLREAEARLLENPL